MGRNGGYSTPAITLGFTHGIPHQLPKHHSRMDYFVGAKKHIPGLPWGQTTKPKVWLAIQVACAQDRSQFGVKAEHQGARNLMVSVGTSPIVA